MADLKKSLKEMFPKQYSEKGLLPKLRFKPYAKPEHKLLVIGSEHGDKPFGAKAMIELMKQLKKNKLEKTLIDFIPVIDVKGYPNKRTIMGDAGFGKPLYLDNGYVTDKKPQEISDLLSAINGSYDLVVQLNSNFVEEAPLLNGYYAIMPVKIVQESDKERLVYDPVVKDLVGAIVNHVKSKGFKLLNKDKEVYLGDGHIWIGEGLVLPGVKEQDKVKPKNRNALVLKCAEKNVTAVLLYAVATKVQSEERSNAVKAHKAALDALIKLYEL